MPDEGEPPSSVRSTTSRCSFCFPFGEMGISVSRIEQVASPLYSLSCPSRSKRYPHGPTPRVFRITSTPVKISSGVSGRRLIG